MTQLQTRLRRLEGRGASGNRPTFILLKAKEGAINASPKDGQVWAAIIPGYPTECRLDDETEGEFLFRIFAQYPHLDVPDQMTDQQIQAAIDAGNALTIVDSFGSEAAPFIPY